MSDLEHGSTVGGSPILTQRNFPNHQHGPEDMRGLGNSALYDKSDSTGLDDTNSIATSKAVHDLRLEIVDLDARYIMKNEEDNGSVHIVNGRIYMWLDGGLVQIYPAVWG